MADLDDDLSDDEAPLKPAEMWGFLAWFVGIVGGLWLGLKIVTTLFPDGEPLLLLASVAIPEAAILYGIALWRRRSNA